MSKAPRSMQMCTLYCNHSHKYDVQQPCLAYMQISLWQIEYVPGSVHPQPTYVLKHHANVSIVLQPFP